MRHRPLPKKKSELCQSQDHPTLACHAHPQTDRHPGTGDRHQSERLLVFNRNSCSASAGARILPLRALDILKHLPHRRLSNVQIGAAREVPGLDFEGIAHDVLRSLTFIAIDANTYTMAFRSPGSRGSERDAAGGCRWTLALDRLRAQPDMPRHKKSISPLRPSGGRASPSIAARKVSYWATTLDTAVESASPALGVTAEFFFHGRRAQSSLDARRGRTARVSILPTRAP